MNQFSIILPVKNGGEHVKECVSSILKQSYTNFNLIVLDNNSSDGTKEWIENLKDDRIIVHPSLISLTIVENWARALTVEKNEFMTLIGHDDILYSDYLYEMNELIIHHPTASLYHSHFNYIDNNSKIIRACKEMPLQLNKTEFVDLFLNNKIDSMGTGYVMKSEDFNNLNGFPTNYPSLLFADFELWLKLTSINYEVISKKNCFAFRIHQSTTTTSSNSKFINAFEIFLKFLYQIVQTDEKLNVEIKKHALNYIKFYCKGISHRIIKTPIVNREKKYNVKSVIKLCKQYADLIVPTNSFYPTKIWHIKLAYLIDESRILSKMFLMIKRNFKKPLLN